MWNFAGERVGIFGADKAGGCASFERLRFEWPPSRLQNSDGTRLVSNVAREFCNARVCNTNMTGGGGDSGNFSQPAMLQLSVDIQTFKHVGIFYNFSR